jgi:hypothetical protein
MLSKHISALLILLAAVFLVLGIRLADDYGLGWDEPVARMGGIITHRYVVEGDQALVTYRDRYYGPAFEGILYALEKITGTTDPYTIFALRHTATFFLFFISVITMYFLTKGIFGTWWWGLAGAVLLVLHPRIFAESFYNSKDIGFLASWVIGIFFGYRYYTKPTVGRAVCFGVAAAFATDIRIMGVLLHSIGIAVGVRSFMRKKYEVLRSSFIVYVFISIVFTILWWPTLWGNPLVRFIEAARFMATFKAYKMDILYMGKFLSSLDAPWHYLPVWVGITTPLSIVALWFVGAWKALVNKRTFWQLFFVIIPVCVIVLVVVFRPALYDGWRQFYFIYPCMVITALFGLQWVFRLSRKIHVIVVILIIVNMSAILSFSIRNHPHQYVYFNEIIGGMKGAEGRFDLDYWGVSYRKGLEYIASIDSRPTIKAFFAFGIGAHADVLRVQHRRFVPVKRLEEADYVLSNFRWQKQKPPLSNIYDVWVDGVSIMGAYTNMK